MSVFVVILVWIFPYSDQNNSEYGHFAGTDTLSVLTRKISQTTKCFDKLLSIYFQRKQNAGETLFWLKITLFCFNNSFSNSDKNLEIPKYEVGDKLHLNMNIHPILKGILKYRNHSNVDKNTVGCQRKWILKHCQGFIRYQSTNESFKRECWLFCRTYFYSVWRICPLSTFLATSTFF